MAGGVMAASAQADTLGPEPLLPCTQLSADKLAEDVTPTDESPLAELESFLARMHDNPFDAHVEQTARCYPLYFDPEVWPTWA
jgi:hypothetical protein